jgi:transposase
MERHEYPSDITRQQFEQIRLILEVARKETKPRKVDLYDIFCAILYIIKSGCQWRMLPSDFPKWQLVYYYYYAWSYKNSPDNPSIQVSPGSTSAEGFGVTVKQPLTRACI